MIRRTLAVLAVAVGLMAAGAQPALACGDTPGFCPNPPGCTFSSCPYDGHGYVNDSSVGR
jgi:hypothetical protein